MAEITHIVRRNGLLFTMTWLALSSVLMYQRSIFDMTPAFEYVNLALLAALIVYVVNAHYSAGSGAVTILFLVATVRFGWQQLGGAPATSVSLLAVLQVATVGFGYIAATKYSRADITRQLLAAGWFTWFWCLFGLAFQLATRQTPNAAAIVVFQPHAGALYLVMLLAFGVEIAGRRERRLYLALGALMVLTTIWRARISVVMIAALGAAYLWARYLRRRALWIRVIAVMLATVGAAAGIYGLARVKMSSVAMRAELWEKVLTIIAEHPLCGVGLGRLHVYSAVETHFDIPKKVFECGWTRVMLPNDAPAPMFAAHAHNAYLTCAAEMGLIGCTAVGAFLWLLWLTRSYRPAGANYALLAFLVSNLTGDSLHLWVIAALVVSSAALTRWQEWWDAEGEGVDWPRQHAVAALGVFYLAMAAVILAWGRL